MKTPDPFIDADSIRAATAVRYVEIHDELLSTNVRAVELARRAETELPALVVARLQTAGKGRGQHTWWSADGALTFSLLIDAAVVGVEPAAWPQLSLATAVAVCDALIDCTAQSFRPQLKWPNDVLLDGRKVCGILIESPGGAATAKNRLVVGIGINVNNSWNHAPNTAGPCGIALCDVAGYEFDLKTLLLDVLAALTNRFNQLHRGDKELMHAWQRLDYLAGGKIIVQSEARITEGRCVRIADDGALVVETPSGPRSLYSGSVQLA